VLAASGPVFADRFLDVTDFQIVQFATGFKARNEPRRLFTGADPCFPMEGADYSIWAEPFGLAKFDPIQFRQTLSQLAVLCACFTRAYFGELFIENSSIGIATRSGLDIALP
jgi:hypothetical protein